MKEFLLSLQSKPQRNLCIGGIVIMRDEHLPCNRWQLAQVSSIYPSTDVRVCTVQHALEKTARHSKGRRVSEERFLERPIHKLALLMSREEQEGR